ncbi:hypothetical protein PPERSA_03310 [Pseudocohnilembus persalinus]|uniref:Multi antimicrobial extrusion protein n=1 Tax=Pseudocohnilembus persalinus TaxID=266149 RepID=A0A0V0Q8J8_PSEPJ|nr:hypothetical protein PPERSA_03310 [Pseudocohnilembus persalinus]|eukprot:KRW98479.1 hypothetical protein PPERSA_03310 [Pseudocohnilembus persalinus]
MLQMIGTVMYHTSSILFANSTNDIVFVSGFGLGASLYQGALRSVMLTFISGLYTLLSQANGAKNYKKMGEYINKCILIGCSYLIIIFPLIYLFLEYLLVNLNIDENVAKVTSEFVIYSIFGALFFLLSETLKSVFMALKEFQTTMIIKNVSYSLTPVFIYIFMRVFDLGLFGLALGRIIADLSGFLISLFYFYKKQSQSEVYKQIFQNIFAQVFNIKEIIEFFKKSFEIGAISYLDYLFIEAPTEEIEQEITDSVIEFKEIDENNQNESVQGHILKKINISEDESEQQQQENQSNSYEKNKLINLQLDEQQQKNYQDKQFIQSGQIIIENKEKSMKEEQKSKYDLPQNSNDNQYNDIISLIQANLKQEQFEIQQNQIIYKNQLKGSIENQNQPKEILEIFVFDKNHEQDENKWLFKLRWHPQMDQYEKLQQPNDSYVRMVDFYNKFPLMTIQFLMQQYKEQELKKMLTDQINREFFDMKDWVNKLIKHEMFLEEQIKQKQIQLNS